MRVPLTASVRQTTQALSRSTVPHPTLIWLQIPHLLREAALEALPRLDRCLAIRICSSRRLDSPSEIPDEITCAILVVQILIWPFRRILRSRKEDRCNSVSRLLTLPITRNSGFTIHPVREMPETTSSVATGIKAFLPETRDA